MLTLTNSKLNILNAFVEVVCIHNLLKHTDTNSDLSEDTSSVVCCQRSSLYRTRDSIFAAMLTYWHDWLHGNTSFTAMLSQLCF